MRYPQVNLRAHCYDSATERDFAYELEKHNAIKLYVKLQGWFKVPTSLGSYTPDWVVLVEGDDTQRLYFVVEIKSSKFADGRRNTENVKITCGKAHFVALALDSILNPAQYIDTNSVVDLLNAR